MRLLAVSAASAWCLGATGCLFTPGNDQVVCGADDDVAFSGYLTVADSPVALQASTSPSDPFVTVGTTTSRLNATTLTGQSYYSFSGSADIDDWKTSPTGLTVRLRAQSGSVNLLTFEEQNAAGQSGLTCVLAGVIAGQTASTAALDCDRNDSVLEIQAPLLSTCSCTPYSVPGDLIIDSARDAALARCVTSVGGALRVMPTAPDLVSLAQLTSIGGDAELHYEFQDTNGLYRNREIDLSALTSIGGNVDLRTRRGSTQPKTLDTKTNAVTFIGGDVVISTYDNNVNAFGSVTSVTGSITLQGFDGPSSNLDIFAGSTFPSLTSIGGNLTVQGFFACNAVFNSVTTVTGDVRVRAVRLFPSESFTNLTSVGGNLIFQEMKVFGPPWAALTSVGQELQLLDNASLTALSTVPIGAVNVDGVRIEGQPTLTTLDGTFQAGAGNITILGNPNLSQCDVDAWLTALTAGGWTGVASVADTVPCP